jgi:AcrR family transcriptional regulator
MAVPLKAAPSWSELGSDGKRARLLEAAGEVFASRGLDAPMPAVAAAAGAGVGSVYRQFPSKRELLAALVVERLEEAEDAADAALASADGPWVALIALLRDFSERHAADEVRAEAMASVSTDPDVVRALAGTSASWERLMDAAKAEGRLRADATMLDVHLIFAAIRAAGPLEPGAWERMLELGIDALAARC